MWSFRHILIVLSFHGKANFHSRDIQFFIFQAILSTSKVLSSWTVLAQNVEYISEYIFWIMKHFVLKLGSLINIVMGITFAWFDRLYPKGRSFLIYKPSTIDQKPVMMRCAITKLKNSNNTIWIIIPFDHIHQRTCIYFQVFTIELKKGWNACHTLH